MIKWIRVKNRKRRIDLKKNILRSCLVSPIIIGAFLSSGQVFAEENTTTQSTTVTENVQSSVEQSGSLQLNSDSVIFDDNETNNSLPSSEVQNETQNLSDADKQDSAIANGQEAEKMPMTKSVSLILQFLKIVRKQQEILKRIMLMIQRYKSHNHLMIQQIVFLIRLHCQTLLSQRSQHQLSKLLVKR